MLVRYSIYRSIAILVNIRYGYLMVSRYFDISNDQTILGRYIVRSGVSSHSILQQPSIWKHCPKTPISRYLLLIVRLSIHQTSILVSSIAKRFLVILKYRRTKVSFTCQATRSCHCNRYMAQLTSCLVHHGFMGTN